MKYFIAGKKYHNSIDLLIKYIL